MLIIKIYCLEDREESNIITVMKEGEHSIGRGDTLNCNDKRVSRKHAMIIVTKTKVTFKSTHINPSFYKAANGKNIQLLKNNDSILLNDGDQFALLADKFWFKVKIEHVENEQNCDTDIASLDRLKNTSCDETTTNASLNDSANITSEGFGHPDRNCDGNKTINESSDLITTSIENNVETKVSSTTCTSNFFNSKDDFGQNQSEQLPLPINECDQLVGDLIEGDSKEETLSKAENDISDASNESLDLAAAAIDTKIYHVSKSDVENEEEPKATSSVKDANLQTNNNDSKPKTKRDRCWYGNSCYRKNPDHRVQFSHPGDDDYDSDPAEDKPKCPYGVTCYRRNADHRKQFKHSHQPIQHKTATTKNDTESDKGDGTSQKKRKKTTKTNSESDQDDGTSDNNSDSNKDGERQMSRKKVKNYQESSEDDYDMEDPFINDNSSDDYQPTSDDSDDSNWEDSQQVEEESEETKRLIKEAKKFTKVKRKK